MRIFYITFHDWGSNKLGWPTYEETYQSIDHALMKRFIVHKENMITEQLNGILIKKEQYKDFLNWPVFHHILLSLDYNNIIEYRCLRKNR